MHKDAAENWSGIQMGSTDNSVAYNAELHSLLLKEEIIAPAKVDLIQELPLAWRFFFQLAKQKIFFFF